MYNTRAAKEDFAFTGWTWS